MHVIITGGRGFIGSALSKYLVEKGDRVTILSRSTAERPPAHPEAQIVRWDGKTSSGWGHLLEEADAIINLAGENLAAGLWTQERKQRILHSRVDSGKAIIAALRESTRKPEVLIQSSGINFYGGRGDQPVDETCPPGADFLADVCVRWENSTQEAESLGLRRCVIRSGLVLEKNGGVLPLMALPFRFFVGGKLGSGRQWISWIHLRDEVRAIDFLLRNSRASGSFNLTAPQAQTNQEFSRALGKALGSPAWLPTPGLAIKLALGEMSTLVLDGRQVIPARLQEMGFEFQFPSLQAALHAIYG